jgi:hypothetical protein
MGTSVHTSVPIWAELQNKTLVSVSEWKLIYREKERKGRKEEKEEGRREIALELNYKKKKMIWIVLPSESAFFPGENR